jgi:hypothetical protein
MVTRSRSKDKKETVAHVSSLKKRVIKAENKKIVGFKRKECKKRGKRIVDDKTYFEES